VVVLAVAGVVAGALEDSEEGRPGAEARGEAGRQLEDL